MSYTISNMTTETVWDIEKGPVKTYNFFFAFTTREEYLEETAAWKAEYKELSKRIRQCKLERKPKNRKDGEQDYQVQYRLNTLKEQARMMLQMRKQAKKEAGRQSALKLAA